MDTHTDIYTYSCVYEGYEQRGSGEVVTRQYVHPSGWLWSPSVR